MARGGRVRPAPVVCRPQRRHRGAAHVLTSPERGIPTYIAAAWWGSALGQVWARERAPLAANRSGQLDVLVKQGARALLDKGPLGTPGADLGRGVHVAEEAALEAYTDQVLRQSAHARAAFDAGHPHNQTDGLPVDEEVEKRFGVWHGWRQRLDLARTIRERELFAEVLNEDWRLGVDPGAAADPRSPSYERWHGSKRPEHDIDIDVLLGDVGAEHDDDLRSRALALLGDLQPQVRAAFAERLGIELPPALRPSDSPGPGTGPRSTREPRSARAPVRRGGGVALRERGLVPMPGHPTRPDDDWTDGRSLAHGRSGVRGAVGRPLARSTGRGARLHLVPETRRSEGTRSLVAASGAGGAGAPGRCRQIRPPWDRCTEREQRAPRIDWRWLTFAMPEDLLRVALGPPDVPPGCSSAATATRSSVGSIGPAGSASPPASRSIRQSLCSSL